MSDRRSSLLDAAIEEIAAVGTRGMRVDAVARRAGVSVALIYHHFGDRSSLLVAALEQVGARADAYTARSASASAAGTAREQLIALLEAEIQDDPEVRVNSAAWGELRDAAIFDPTLRATIASLTEQWVDDLAALVVVGHADGSIPPARSPHDVGVQLSVAVEGISPRWLNGTLSTKDARRHLVAIARELTS